MVYQVATNHLITNRFWNDLDGYCQEFRECLGFVTTKGSEDSSDKLNQ